MLDEQLDEAKAHAELQEILTEQHQGRWICPEGKDADKHKEWVGSRINRGIELTAILRGYVTSAKPGTRKKASGKSKAEIAAIITEDLLS